MSNRSKKDRRLAKLENNPPVPEYNILAAFRSGPLPPPAEMEKYEVLYPGATKLLLDNFVKQTDHRIELENAVIKGDNKRANRGQIISALLAFLCISFGGVLTYLGKDAVGLSLIFGSIASLLAAFYGGTLLRKKEREIKRKKING